ncbi:MAG: hypothetical protein SFW36_17635 [Leptolyngbyaceae cyanobacterium bins.59]|nr:hypothetical protein [Leptolyngbyaceae cyanobacterium bins.59]
MRGRLIDAWKYTWLELWEPLEQVPDFSEDIYSDLFVQLEKALKKRLKTAPDEDKESHSRYFETSTDPVKARLFIQEIDGQSLAGDPALVAFFKNAYDVFNEYSEEFADEFVQLMDEFVNCHNLRYKLQYSPFKLQPHLPGVFASLFAEISEAAAGDRDLLELMKDFEHSFYAVSRSHRETDMKTCISKACMLIEGFGSLHPERETASTLGAMCNKIRCWPHEKLREAVINVYHFCCDYPGIRHAGTPASKLRALDLRDSIIVPLILFTAAGYFLTQHNITEVIGINAEDY